MSESSTTHIATFIPSDQYEPINDWYRNLHPTKKIWVDDNWKSLLDGMLEYLQNSVDESVPEAENDEEDILSIVGNVNDLLEYTTIQPGQEGWTEAYRQHCKGTLESNPSYPSEGFRVYAPAHAGFVSEHDTEGRTLRLTTYYQTMSGGDGTYAESGYFVREQWNNGHKVSTEVYEAKRKPLGVFECTYIRDAYPVLTWIDKSSVYKPDTIYIRRGA